MDRFMGYVEASRRNIGRHLLGWALVTLAVTLWSWGSELTSPVSIVLMVLLMLCGFGVAVGWLAAFVTVIKLDSFQSEVVAEFTIIVSSLIGIVAAFLLVAYILRRLALQMAWSSWCG